MNFWRYFSCIFLGYCVPELVQQQERQPKQKYTDESFQVEYEWSHLNFTWDSSEHYHRAIQSEHYIPKNNAPTGMKIYKNTMYLSVPRFRKGIPATLVFFDMELWEKSGSQLLTPYPNWVTNNSTSCSNLQSVQSMEIDTKGTMWVIDGVRINNYTRCPTKLVLFDLNNGGDILHSYTFSQEISLNDGGFLNDLVIDETDGGFAYITDNSQIDPGIIVYSRWKDHSWKLRDVSMFPESDNTFSIGNNIVFDQPAPVDGIALSPKGKERDRTLFFCALAARTLYSIPTNTIKTEELVKTGRWRAMVRNVGQKASQTDGIIIDEKSNMYLTMLPLYGVAKWNINQPLWTSELIHQSRETISWPDGFAFDQNGYLYVISNKVFNYIDPGREPEMNGEIQFRVLRLFTGTRSYLYA